MIGGCGGPKGNQIKLTAVNISGNSTGEGTLATLTFKVDDVKPFGIYQGKSRAAYWDGKNGQGESVASGVYFYTFTAGDFTATRKMLIKK